MCHVNSGIDWDSIIARDRVIAIRTFRAIAVGYSAILAAAIALAATTPTTVSLAATIATTVTSATPTVGPTATLATAALATAALALAALATTGYRAVCCPGCGLLPGRQRQQCVEYA